MYMAPSGHDTDFEGSAERAARSGVGVASLNEAKQ